MNTTIPPSSEKLLTRAETAALLRVEPQTLATWASSGRHALPYIRVGARAMYRASDIALWMAERSGTSTRAIAANA